MWHLVSLDMMVAVALRALMSLGSHHSLQGVRGEEEYVYEHYCQLRRHCRIDNVGLRCHDGMNASLNRLQVSLRIGTTIIRCSERRCCEIGDIKIHYNFDVTTASRRCPLSPPSTCHHHYFTLHYFALP